MIKQCAVCGADFSAPPSGKRLGLLFRVDTGNYYGNLRGNFLSNRLGNILSIAPAFCARTLLNGLVRNALRIFGHFGFFSLVKK